MRRVPRGLLLLPREDLSTPVAEVVEWRLRTHDGLRLWGLRGRSPFFLDANGAWVRQVESCELPTIDPYAAESGLVDLVFQVPAGRRLEDRVLDVVRVAQMCVDHCDVDPEDIHLVPNSAAFEPDEFMIASHLFEQGLLFEE